MKRTKKTQLKVKVGQTWECRDPRLTPQARVNSRFCIVAVNENFKRPEVVVEQVRGPARRRTIALDRFRETSTGYQLVKEPVA